MEEAIDQAIRAIESAANGMTGASMVGDILYATERRADITEAVKALPAEFATAVSEQADKILEACRYRDLHKANALNMALYDILAPFFD